MKHLPRLLQILNTNSYKRLLVSQISREYSLYNHYLTKIDISVSSIRLQQLVPTDLKLPKKKKKTKQKKKTTTKNKKKKKKKKHTQTNKQKNKKKKTKKKPISLCLKKKYLYNF